MVLITTSMASQSLRVVQLLPLWPTRASEGPCSLSHSLVVPGFPRSGRAKDSINLGLLKGVAGPLTYCSSFASIYKAIYHSFLLQGRFLCSHYVLVPISSPFSCDSRIPLISFPFFFSCIKKCIEKQNSCPEKRRKRMVYNEPYVTVLYYMCTAFLEAAKRMAQN